MKVLEQMKADADACNRRLNSVCGPTISGNANRCPIVAERRGKVRALHAQGMATKDIAKRLGVARTKVKMDLYKLRYEQ